MIQLVSCSRCKGFLALALRACPHCDAPIDRARQLMLGIAGLAGGGAVSMTLMACYGAPCIDDRTCVYTPPDAATDASTDAASHDAGVRDSGDAGDAAIDGAELDAASDATSDAVADAPSDAVADAAD